MRVWSGTRAELEKAVAPDKGMAEHYDMLVLGGVPHVLADRLNEMWRQLGDGLLVVWDTRTQDSKHRERCQDCVRRRDCWGPGFYSDFYNQCASGKVDRRVPNEVLRVLDVRAGGRP